RGLEVALGEPDVVRSEEPVGEGVGQVAAVPAVPGRQGRLLEDAQAQADLALVLLVVDGDPDPLRPGEVPIPGEAADPLIVATEAVNLAHGRPAPRRVSADPETSPRSPIPPSYTGASPVSMPRSPGRRARRGDDPAGPSRWSPGAVDLADLRGS